MRSGEYFLSVKSENEFRIVVLIANESCREQRPKIVSYLQGAKSDPHLATKIYVSPR